MNLMSLSRKVVTSTDLSAKLTTLTASDMRKISGGFSPLLYAYVAFYAAALQGAELTRVAKIYEQVLGKVPALEREARLQPALA